MHINIEEVTLAESIERDWLFVPLFARVAIMGIVGGGSMA